MYSIYIERKPMPKTIYVGTTATTSWSWQSVSVALL